MAHRQKTVRSDAEIETILAERVAAQGPGIAIVVRIIHPSGLRVIAQGEPAATGNRAVKSDTLFEIGSLTKVFTALLLTDMAARGHVTITDPVAKYLPPNARSPARFGRAISLADLATHTSSLPFMSEHLGKAGYYVSEYSARDLYAFPARHEVRR